MEVKCSVIPQVVFKVSEQHPSDLAEGLDVIKVVYGEESIPTLYENSRISQVQLPGHPGALYFRSCVNS